MWRRSLVDRFNRVMSTVDPSIAKLERQNRRPSTVSVVVLLLVLFMGGFVTGYGWASFGVVSAATPDEPPIVAIVAIPLGMMLLIGGSIVWLSIVMRRSDIGIMYGNAAALLGAGVGVLTVEAGADAAAGDSALVTIVGVVLLVLAAGALALGLSAAAARRRDRQRAERAMQSGMLTTATVSDQGWTVFRESTRIFTTVTFTFVDLAGTRRWVQRQMLIRAENPVRNGAETRLWYDAANPGDDRSIVVELAQQNPLRPLGR